MKPPPRPGALLVATRELRWMRRDGLALFLVIGVPLIAFALLAWTFSSAVIRDLRVTIVDGDRTPASMNYVQALASSPGLRVDRRSGDLTDAMHAVRSGDALGAVYIPENFERDLMGRKRPQIVMFYNRQYFTPGNNASSAMSSAIAAATAGLPSPTQQAKTPATTGSLVVEQYVLTNPALNFAQFLMRAILPTTLHIVIAIAAGYAVGSEFSSRNSAAWLRAAGGSPLAALVGKLAPLFAMFVVMLVVEAGIVHGVFHVPFRGDSVIAGAGGCLLVIGYLSMGALFQLLIRKLAVGLSVTAVFCSPAFGFAGVGFPLLAMNGFSHFWGALLPLRWYIQILFDQAVRGLPPIVSVEPLVVLAVLAAVLFALSWWRLSAIAHTPPRRVPRPEPVPEAPASAGIGAAMFAEIRRVLHDQSALGLIVLAPLLYGALYPQPYLGQLLRDLPIAVVDQDNTEVSRQFVQALNSDEAISVAVRAGSLAEAQAALATRQVFGIVEVPAGTEREILKGNQARIAAYVDSAYFLLYSRTSQGISDSAAAANEAIAAHGARLDGSLAHAALIGISAVEAVSEPLFNPTGAYASYVVPAAFILILQQSLLMGTATLGGVAFEQGGLAARRQRGSLRSVIGQGLAHLCLEVPGLALYLIVLPRVYGFSTLGGVLDLVLMAIPFVLSVSFLAQFVSFWFKRRETAVLLFIASSLPLFFMVGVAWPVEAIPGTIRTLSRLFPSTSAIDGLVRINQMGASLRDVSREWLTLWVLAVVYATLAALASWVAKRREGAVA
jgi:ABC-2 type transport system permease protein